MRHRVFLAAAIAMVVVAAVVRLNNAFRFPVMNGYDAFAHFAYIWFLAETGRVPAATAGWEFFQPPGYYAVMLVVWKAFSGVDAILRLRVGTALMALVGLAQALVCFVVIRRYFPGDRLLQLLGAGLMLFLPVHLYSSGFLGNEVFCAALCSLALLALLWTLRHETFGRAAILGLVLGAAMLVKFTALAVVATAFAALGLRALIRGRLWGGVGTLSVVATVMLAVCGWFYVRNAMTYGNPFQMSREQLFLSHVENSQPQAKRTVLEYVLFDPLILYEPQWPRGRPLSGYSWSRGEYSAARESVPTGLYANTWFDGYGGFALPPIRWSATVRGAGQVLLTLGMVPTLLIALGVWTGIGDLRRKGWDDTVVTMLLASAAMAGIVVLGTRSVPTQAAVKATYLMPVSVAFGFWFALGVDRIRRSRPSLVRPVVVLCGLLALVSVAVFTHGLVITDSWTTRGGGGPAFRNLYGMVYLAAGDRQRARELFEWAAQGRWPLALENLAALDLEDGRPEAALAKLEQAMAIEESKYLKVGIHQRRYVQVTLAEYANARAVILRQLDRNDEALEAAETARRLDPSIPEAAYNVGVLKLMEAVTLDEGPRRGRLLKQSRRAFEESAEADPAFYEAWAMVGVAKTLAGHCAAGAEVIRRALAPEPHELRAYPFESGPGDQNAAGLLRRRRIEELPPSLEPVNRLNACLEARA